MAHAASTVRTTAAAAPRNRNVARALSAWLPRLIADVSAGGPMAAPLSSLDGGDGSLSFLGDEAQRRRARKHFVSQVGHRALRSRLHHAAVHHRALDLIICDQAAAGGLGDGLHAVEGLALRERVVVEIERLPAIWMAVPSGKLDARLQLSGATAEVLLSP